MIHPIVAHILRSPKISLYIRLVGLCLAVTMQGCSYTTAVSTTNIPANTRKKVTATTKRFIILGLVFDNDEVLDLPRKLQDKCPEGAVRGITTHNINTFYLLAFLWQREVVATGYCVKQSITAQNDVLEDVVSPEAEVAAQEQPEGEVNL